jgi:uncharacterized protein YjiS (DUF1127 family)
MKTLITWWKKHRAYREAYNELNKLSTRELDDIGIHRSMITRLALEHAEKV